MAWSIRLTRAQAEQLIGLMDGGETKAVTLGIYVGLTADDANAPEWLDFIASLKRLRGESEALAEAMADPVRIDVKREI